MQYDHKRHKAALEFLSEKFDLPISEVMDALKWNERREAKIVGGHQLVFNMRDEYKLLAGFEWHCAALKESEKHIDAAFRANEPRAGFAYSLPKTAVVHPGSDTGPRYVPITYENVTPLCPADPVQIIRDLIADLGSTHAQLPSVRRAYAYLDDIEPK